ncbi:MAG: c-type cytochrome, partial [Burkholderiales bacterium]
MALARIRAMRSGVLILSLTMLAACEKAPESGADPGDAAQVALGAKIYAQHCGACHGMKLEG